MTFTQVPVIGTYELADGTPAVGTVRFTPTVPMHNDGIVIAAPVVAELDEDGALSTTLAATDDTATLPVGVGYRVELVLVGQPTHSYLIVVPNATAGSLDLADAVPATLTAAAVDTLTQTQANALYQPLGGALDSDLSTIAGLAPANNDLLQRKAGAWANRTPSQVKTDLALVKGDVGLGSVDNTSDTAKPVSTATQAALDLKAATSHTHDGGGGGGGGYATVQDEGTARTQRGTVNFVGAGVTVTDDAANTRTVVTIPGGGGSSSAVVFSADTSGSANAATALTTQATTAAAAGVPLIVPPGNYLMTATSVLPANLTMWAPSGARFFGVVADAGLVTVGSGTRITGVTFQNTSEPNGCSATIRASAVNVTFDHCTLIAPSIGVHANQSGIRKLTVTKCRIQDTYFGVLTNSGANDIKDVLVEGCDFTGILGDAIEFNHPSGSAPTCSGFRVVGNNIEGTTGGSGTNTGFGVGVAGCSDVAITGNTIVGMRREGVHVEDGSRSVTITGNTVRNIPASATARGGICIYGVGTDDVTVTGNTVIDINGTGIELVYAGDSDLVSNVTVSNNIVRGCTVHGMDLGAEAGAGESWIVANNVIRDCVEYGIVLRGSHQWAMVQGNMIDSVDVGIGAGHHGSIRAVRDNIITNWGTADYDGFGEFSGSLNLSDRNVLRTQTATTTTMAYSLFRIGQRAEGSVAVALTGGGSRWLDSLWRIRWTGDTLGAFRVASSNFNVDDTGMSVVDGVLTVTLASVANGVAMSGTANFSGMLIEDSADIEGTVVGAPFDDGQTGGGGGPGSGSDVLAQWTTALAGRASTPARWLGIGQSLQEGWGATTGTNTWFHRALAGIRAANPTTGVAQAARNYVQTYHRSIGGASWTNETTGNSGSLGLVDSTYATVSHKTVSMASGATMTFNVSGTSVDIDWVRGSGGGTFTWRVDGGSTTSVSTAGAYQAINRTHVTFGSRGSHTVTIAATTGPVYISGLFVYDQDENAGIHGYDGGWSGATINIPYLQDLGAGGWPTVLAAVAPDLVTIDLGGNDGINGTSIGDWEANARQLIELLQSLPKVPSIVWCTSYQVASSITGTSFAPMDAVIKDLADEYGIGVVSWYDDIDQVGTGNTVGNWTGDGIHPANSGHQMLADLVIAYLTA